MRISGARPRARALPRLAARLILRISNRRRQHAGPVDRRPGACRPCCDRPCRDRLCRERRADLARAAPGRLRPVARQGDRHARGRERPRPHRLRFPRRQLRRLRAHLPPGDGARERRGRVEDLRHAHRHLRDRRRAELPVPHRFRDGGSGGEEARRRCRAPARRRPRGAAEAAEARALYLRRRPAVPLRPHEAADRGGTLPARPHSRSRSSTAPTTATRSTTRSP